MAGNFTRFLAIAAAVALCWLASLVGAQARQALVITIDGGIGPATTEYVRRGLDAAAQRNAPLVILRMNTPGGLDSATRDIVRAILASPVPVAAFVAPSGGRAASAGTYILYASHLAAMAPATNLGAATPVRMGGGGGAPTAPSKEGETKEPAGPGAMERKIINDSVAWIRGLAEMNGRNADWAEKAVREGVSASSSEAAKIGVVEIIATDERDLLAQADGRTVRVAGKPLALATANVETELFERDWRLRILSFIADPNIAYILLLLGAYGLFFEILSPGAMVPGAIGAVSLLVGLYALNLMDVSVAGVLLLVLGLAFMAAEALTPTFGVFGIAGLVAFVTGSIFLVREAPPQFALSPWVIFAGAAVSAGVFGWAALVGVRQLRKPVTGGQTDYIDAEGVVTEWSGSSGRVRVRGEIWGARAQAQPPAPLQAAPQTPFAAGAPVRVLRRDGLTLIVAPLATAHNGDSNAV